MIAIRFMRYYEILSALDAIARHRTHGSQASFRQISYRVYVERRIVQRFRAIELYAACFRIVAKQYIDIVKNLDMITDKADWLNKHASLPGLLKAGNRILHCGTKPFATRHALALKRELPRTDLGDTPGNQLRRLASLRFVGITFGNGTLGDTVCGKNHRQRRSMPLAGRFPSLTQSLGECVDQQGVIVPLLHEVNGEWRASAKQHLLVETYASAGIVRSQADRHRLLHPVVCHLLQSIGDEGMPFAHAHICRDPQLACNPVRLPQCQTRQGRNSDLCITVLNFLYHSVRHRTSARNVLQKCGDVLDFVGTSVRNQQDSPLAHDFLAVAAAAVKSCTNCARFFTLSTGVCGRMPCPRLKM